MGGAQFAVAFDVPLLQQVSQSLVVVGNFLVRRDALENLAVLVEGRVADLDLVAQAAQEGFVHQVLRRQVGGENHQHVEGDFELASRVQGHVIHAVFERDDPAVEQVARAHLLAAKIVNQQDAAIGLDLERGFVKFMRVVEDQVEACEGQLAADHDERTADLDPARVAPRGRTQVPRPAARA